MRKEQLELVKRLSGTLNDITLFSSQGNIRIEPFVSFTLKQICSGKFKSRITSLPNEIGLLRDEISELKRLKEESSETEKETDTILADADEFEKARRLTKEMVDRYIDVVYVYDAEYIEVKLKATAVMDRNDRQVFCMYRQ